MRAIPIEILGVYSDPDRDPRQHIISVVFICEFKGKPEAGDDARAYEWVLLESIGKEKIAFDHQKIIGDYISWKSNKRTFWSSK